MEGKISNLSARHRELADQLKGSMDYNQHYAYLLDWYVNDRNGWLAQAPKPEPKPNGNTAEAHLKDCLKDVVDALKHLDRRIDIVSNGHSAKVKAKVRVRPGRAGNIFTKLVDKRRFDGLNRLDRAVSLEGKVQKDC